MAIRQARLEPPALSGSGQERMVYGPTTASGEKRIDLSAGIAWFSDILNIEGSFVEVPSARRLLAARGVLPIPLLLDSDRRTFPSCPAAGRHREPRWTIRERSRPATNDLLFPLGRNGTEPVSELEQRRFLYSRSLLLCPIHASRAAQGFATARIVAGRCADCKGVEFPCAQS